MKLNNKKLIHSLVLKQKSIPKEIDINIVKPTDKNDNITRETKENYECKTNKEILFMKDKFSHFNSNFINYQNVLNSRKQIKFVNSLCSCKYIFNN